MADGQFGGRLTWNAIILIFTIMHIILIIHRHSIPMDDGDMAHYRSLGRVWQLNCQLIRSDYSQSIFCFSIFTHPWSVFSEKPTLIFETRTRISSGVLSCLETRLRNLIDFLHFRDKSDNFENENSLIRPKEKYFSSFQPFSLQIACS